MPKLSGPSFGVGGGNAEPFSFYIPVSKGGYEVKAAVNSVIHNVAPVQATLVVEVSFKLIVDVVDDGFETGE